MAKMFPERFPFPDDPKREAEHRVFEALRTGLPNAWTVLYGVAWLEARPGAAAEGEADFVLLHANRGVLAMEVKGGGIARNAKTGLWSSRDRHGIEHEIKDPFKQASNAANTLGRYARRVPRWAHADLPVARAVCFPDVHVQSRNILPTDAPRDIVLDRADLPDVLPCIERAYAFCLGTSPRAFGPEGVDALRGLLARSFQIEVPFVGSLEADERRIFELTEAQFMALSLLSAQRRVRIEGGAGTGKTVLAVEKARRLASAGHRTLFTCYTRALAEHVKDQLADVPNVVVETFHGLCVRAGQDLSLALPHPQADGTYPAEAYSKHLPEALQTALEQGWPRFDAIVVDEGQDLEDLWWLLLQESLSGGDQGLLYVFMDPGQRMFGRKDVNFPSTLPLYTLTHNLRNTRAIQTFAAPLSPGVLPGPSIPDGQPVERIVASSPDEQLRALVRTIDRLVVDEKVPVSSIVVVTCRKRDIALPTLGERLGAFPVTENPRDRTGAALVSSAWKVKGLERMVCVALVPESVERPRDDRALYVALTRGRSHLIVIAPGTILSDFPA
jgi:hypothetical protein